MNAVKDIANKILMSLGEPFLSGHESGLLPTDPDNLKGIYEALFTIMQERKSPQASMDKLKAKALLDGITIPPKDALKKYGSNVLLGFGVDE